MRERIAITGIGCRFPGEVRSPEDYWQLLRDGVDAVTRVPSDRWDADAWYDADPKAPGKTRTRFGSFLSRVDQFDADFFGISGREARQMDPQQRLLLEVTWEALENAGVAPDGLAGTRTGVYVGLGVSDYARRSFAGDAADLDPWSGTGSFSSVAAGRIAYVLGLEGPALALHTACSSSLVAVHLAMEALRSGQIDRAIAGGVSLMLSPEPTVYFSKLQAISTDGRCRTFDASATGYGRGEGCGMVILERLDEVTRRGDPAIACLAGSRINHDGRSNGLTAPSARAQKALLAGALADADTSAEAITYVEAHGTGTPLGDPIEMEAIGAVYGPGEAPCRVGSAKTNFGHLESAAGIAGLIKVALCLHHRAIPPHLHLETLNPRIALDGTRLSIPTEHRSWDGEAAAVSAFGLAGTNAHVILERAPPHSPPAPDPSAQLLVFSGHTAEARDAVCTLPPSVDLSDAASTLVHGRKHQGHRRAVVASNLGEAVEALRATPGRRAERDVALAWAFTGQGAQSPRMDSALYRAESAYREAFDAVDSRFQPLLGASLRDRIDSEDPKSLLDTRWTQPALFATGWALSALWRSWGLSPDRVLGHSIGEITAAAVAGVFELDDAIRLVAERGRLLSELPRDGAMAAIRADLDTVRGAMGEHDRVGIAALNSPADTVISGDLQQVEAVLERLASRGVKGRRLEVSHAFHSPLVDPICEAFEAVAQTVRFHAPQIPIVSALTGKPAGPEIGTATYWAAHLRRPVRFASALEATPETLFLEIGPHAVLSALGPRCRPDSQWVPSLRKGVPEREALLGAVGALYTAGVDPDWTAVVPRRPPVPLPTTAFQRQRHWIEPSVPRSRSTAPSDAVCIQTWSPTPPGPALPGTWAAIGDEALHAQLGGMDPDRAENLVICVHGTGDEAWMSGVHTMLDRLRHATCRLFALTTRAQSPSGETVHPHHATLWGLTRVLALEHPERWGGILDRAADATPDDVADALMHLPEEAAALREGELWVPRLVRTPLPATATLDTRGTWLVAGGTGAIGMHIARWLADQGVHHLVLTSRSGEADIGDLPATVHGVDLADEAAMASLIDAMDPPLTGVIHAAGVAAPTALMTASEDALRAPLGAKLAGTLTLDRLTRHRDVSAFVVFTSIAGVWGSANLGAYAAANAFQDAVMAQRRADGLPGLSIAWGPWADGGMVSPTELERFARLGIRPLGTADALDLLGGLLGSRGTRVVADVDWGRLKSLFSAKRPRRLLDRLGPPPSLPGPRATPTDPAEVGDLVTEVLSRILGRTTPLDPEVGFFDAGMDSLTAVEFADTLAHRLHRDLPPTVAFDHPNLRALLAHLSGEQRAQPIARLTRSDEPIAIIGMSCRYPGAPDPEGLWRVLRDGVDTITEVPASRWDIDAWFDPVPGTPGRMASRHGGFLDNITDFDNDFFGLSADESTALDPQQRLLLEVSWEAIEDATIAPSSLSGSATAVYVGIGRSDYWDRLGSNPWAGTGNESSFAAGRIAYTLGLRGPALAVNTACSSSLVAVHLAVEALRGGQCDQALAGGVNLLLAPESSAYLSQIRALSPSGRCKTFAADADGYVRSEGCGVLLLRRLSDALDAGDRVLAVIRGTAVGHDGASSGITVPNGPAQQEVLRSALLDAGVEPGEVSYVECHGTGTPLGDPIEIGAVREVYGRDRTAPLRLGAIKTQIGHTETAAGVAGLIKVILSLRHDEIPGNLHQGTPNPALPLDFPVEIPATGTPWGPGPRIAGISSFGISGTNAHVVLEAPPEPQVEGPDDVPGLLLPLSGRSPEALEALANGLDAPDVGTAWTLALGRTHHRYRCARVLPATSVAPLVQGVAPGDRRVGVLFTGQGAQRPGMGKQLYAAYPRFRDALQRCDAALDIPLIDTMFGTDDRIHDTRWAQPALFALEWALFALYQSWGLKPDVLAGHSLGEYVAACASGALTVEDGLRLVAARGALMADLPQTGSMAAAQAAADTVLGLAEGLDIAAINGPSETVVSGPREAISAFVEAAGRQGIRTRELQVSHAFHSHLMAPMLEPFRAVASGIHAVPPTLDVLGNARGEAVTHFDADHWVRHVRATVDFHSVLQSLGQRVDTLLELGPRPVLTAMAGRSLPQVKTIHSLTGDHDEVPEALTALGQLWATGVAVHWPALYGERPRHGDVPKTSWQRKRRWVEDRSEARSQPPPLWAWSWTPTEVAQRPTSGRVHGAGPLADALRLSLPEDPSREIVVAGTQSALEEVAAALEVSRHASHLTLILDSTEAAHSALWGLAAVLFVERPAQQCQVIEVDGADIGGVIRALGSDQDRLQVHSDGIRAPVLRRVEAQSRPLSPGSYLVTGGLGALGSQVCTWLVDRDVTVIAMGRHEPQGPLPDGVRFAQGDVSRAEEVEAVLSEIPDLRGVFHCAGTAAQGLSQEVRRADLVQAFAAKVDGAMHLDSLTHDLDHFVLFGSATAWFGAPGQAAYASANAALDGLARARRDAGEPAVNIGWGPWRVGMAAGADWAREGVLPLSPERALAALDGVLGGPPSIAVIDADWAQFAERFSRIPGYLGATSKTPDTALISTLRATALPARPRVLAASIRDEVCGLLGADPADAGFFDAGMDSLTAVELARRLGVQVGRAVSPTVAFDHPTVDTLTAHLLDALELGADEAPPTAPSAPRSDRSPIAIVGMACRYPGADSPEELWTLMRNGDVPLRDVPRDRWDLDAFYDKDGGPGKMYARQAGFIDGIDQFDPDAFGISPREAASLDPQQRLLLEVAWNARDNAGSTDVRTGVFLGIAERGYLRRFTDGVRPYYPDAWSGTGTESSFAAGRVSHTLGLTGPAISLNTTCSSSLVAVHLAARSLRDGECDTALAGGVHLILDPDDSIYLSQLGALSSDSRCHTFDARANGYVRGEGCGVVVLKRLEDAQRDGDLILGILRGSAVNHDGHSAGLTVPNGTAQQAVLNAALADAEIAPESVGYLEAHGTGTPLGDPIEIAAASAVYGELSIGTIKTHIGHCELAAGIAGVIRALLILRHGEIPAHPDLHTQNPDLPAHRLTIPTENTPWTDHPRRAGVSAFGLSGTNAHVILEAAPAAAGVPPRSGPRLLALSGHSPDAVLALAEQTPRDAATLREHNHRRSGLPYRAATISGSAVRPALRGRDTPVVGLLFTGQGAQYAGMARELYDSEAVYRDMFDRCSAAIGRDLNKIFADDEALTRTRNTQPALGALTLSVAALWRSWGITPAAVAGHSVGEIAAAAFAGCLSIEDAMGLLATRGELMDSLPDGGAMAAVKAGEDRVVPFLADGVSLAGLNHPEETVISGDSAAIDATLAALPGDIEARPLRVSHAFHSACMDPILDRWEDAVAAIDWRAPSLPLVSSLTGAPIEDTDPAFWRRHAREPVRFMEALNALIATGCDTFIEVGPHPVLLGMGQRITDDPSLTWLPSLRRKVDARQAMLEALGAYWVRGGEVDWTAVDGPRGPRVALPPYPFARQRHWLDHDRYAAASATWTVRWAPPTAPTEPLPAAIRVVGTSDLREAIEAELTRAGCTVSATAAAVLDLRPLAHTDLEALCADLLTDAGHDGPHWMVTRGAQIDTRTPQAAAVWGLARCLFLERPMTRGGLIDIDTDTTAAAIVDAMGRATDGIAIRERPLTPTLVPFRSSDDTPSLDGRWLITGGLGSLGLQVADWLADRGVQSLVLTSRRGLPDDPEDARVVAVQALRERGVDVQAAAVDTTDQEAMRALLTPSIRGILHLAGTTTPQAIDDIDPETVAETLAPKIRGAAILDALTEDMELDAFVMFGSIAGVWGSRELSAYAAGNAFLGALARNRRQRGLKALTVHWGPWSGGGMVDAEREARLRRMGLDPIQPREALRTLGCLLTRDEPEVVIAPVRWRDFLSLYEVAGQRPFFDRVRPKQSAPPSPLAPPLPTPPEPADTEAVLRTHVREVLRLPSDRPLPIDAPLLEFGFDSLMATELRTTLLQAGVDVPLGRLLGGPSIEELLIMARARQAPQDRDASPETPEDMPSFLIWSHAAAAIVGAAIATGLFVLLQRMVWP